MSTSSLQLLQLATQFRLDRVDEMSPEEAIIRTERFLPHYAEWAAERDAAIANHLEQQPHLFRMIVPWGPQAFDVAAKASWYFDELLVADPLLQIAQMGPVLTTASKGTLELSGTEQWQRHQRTAVVNSALRKLHSLAPLLEAGSMILLAGFLPARDGDGAMSRLVDAAVLDEPRFLTWLRARARLEAATTVPPTDDSVWRFRRAEFNGMFATAMSREGPIPAGGTVKVQLPRDEEFDVVGWPPLGAGPPQDFRELLDGLVNDYLDRLALAGAGAAHCGTGVLATGMVERNLLQDILNGRANDLTPVQARSDSFSVAAPMLEGLSPVQLVELRARLPTSFAEFRAELMGICRKELSIEEMREEADRVFLPRVRELDGELRAVAASTHLKTRAAGIGSTVCALIGAFFDPALVPASFSVGAGVWTFIKARAHQMETELRAKSKAPLFVWEAKKTSGVNLS